MRKKVVMLYPPTGSFSDYSTPTGVLYVSTVLKNHGYDVRFIDCSVEENYREMVLEEAKDAICIGSYCMSIHIKHLIPLFEEVKRIRPAIKIVLGGAHPTLFPEQTACDPLIDFAVIGEGEETMLELVRFIEDYKTDFSGVKGIACKHNGQVIVTPHRDFIDMDTLPFVDWSMMSQKALDSMKTKIARVQTSRGCPFKCAFCLPKGTLVLTENMTYVPIEEIKIGDVVIGLNKKNRYEKSIVLNTFARKSKVYKIETEGGIVYSTEEHPWLIKRRGGGNANYWRETKNIRVGQYLKKVSTAVEIHEETEDYKKGYVAGAYEGDGSICRVKNYRDYGIKTYTGYVARLFGDEEMMETVLKYSEELKLGLHRQNYFSEHTTLNWSITTQKKENVENIEKIVNKNRALPESEEYKRGYLAGIYDAEGSWTSALRIHNTDDVLLNRVKEYLTHFGFETITEEFEDRKCKTISIINGNGEIISFFSLVNPKVKHKKSRIFEVSPKSRIANSKILSIKLMEEIKDVYNIETTTENYIADGFITHNCINVVSKNGRMRYRSPEKVLDEIEHLVNVYGVRRIGIRDEVFLLNRQKAKEIAQGIIDRGIKITWLANPHVKFLRESWVDDEYMDLLRRSGCTKLQCGGESGSQRILDMLHKTATPEDTLNFVRRTKKHSIISLVAFMTGLPTETREEQLETLKLIWQIMEIAPETFINGAAMFRPYPGGELFDRCVTEYNLEMPNTFRDWANIETLGGNKPPWIERLWFDQNLWTHVTFARLSKIGLLNDTCRKISKRYGLHYAIAAYFYGKLSHVRLKYNYYGFPFEFYALHLLWKWRGEMPELS